MLSARKKSYWNIVYTGVLHILLRFLPFVIVQDRIMVLTVHWSYLVMTFTMMLYRFLISTRNKIFPCALMVAFFFFCFFLFPRGGGKGVGGGGVIYLIIYLFGWLFCFFNSMNLNVCITCLGAFKRAHLNLQNIISFWWITTQIGGQ